jgi:electron transfer flavoprotein alpha subunit
MVAGGPSGENEHGGVLVFVDLPEGELDDAGKGILGEGGKLAQTLAARWFAACFSAGDEVEHFGGKLKWPRTNPRFLGGPPGPFEGFAPYGVPTIVKIQADEDLSDLPDAQAEALASMARDRDARVVLLAHNDLGATLAPGVAARLGGSMFTEAVSYEAGPEGLVLHRRALGNRAVEGRLWTGSVPLVLTVDPKVTSTVVTPSTQPSRPGVERVAVQIPDPRSGPRVLERIPADPQTVDVAEADVIFCAGKGLDPDSFQQLQELCRLLNASLGVTRPVYDLGWADFARMIGQTGKTVAPRFYLGMGISGSMHHVGGIKDSKRVVCLNIDPKAPLFPNSDEGCVADVREVLPLLLDKVKAQVPGGAAA